MQHEKTTETIESIQLAPLQRLETRRWLQLGVLALAIAGLFAILLVLSRTPGMDALFPWIDFFRTALVVHVNQSVLIWSLAMSGVIWAMSGEVVSSRWDWTGIWLIPALAGMVGISVSAFTGDGAPLMNNYVPVLQRPLFFVSLGLFGVGIALRLLVTLGVAARRGIRTSTDLTVIAGFTIALSVLVALCSLGWTWAHLPAGLDPEIYFEYLFWGAGHALQFAFVQTMLFAWIMLAVHSGIELAVSRRTIKALLILGVVPLLAVPVIHTLYPAFSVETRVAFTRLMQFGGGVAAIPVGLIVLWGLIRGSRQTEPTRGAERHALWMSLLLFAAGGAIGGLISGVNTIIPAHYHGSIVGITLALMGLAYLLLPHLGYSPAQGRLAAAQPLIYGMGQLLHITGLAISGAMGIQRKTAGAAQGLDSLGAKVAMGVMGIGGLLAVVGGVLFVWIMLRAFWHRPAA